jgi:hypothetical protein
MKKLKLNLDKKAIQEFFVQHVEKILFVAVALCFLAFVYRAVGREVFTRNPQDLVNDAKDADRKVEATKGESPVTAKDYESEIEKTAGQIDLEFYRHRNLWRPLIVEPPPKRGEPLLFTVRDLRGAAGCGPVRVNPTRTPRMTQPTEEGEEPEGPAMGAPVMGGESIQGERWVVVTGVVPYLEQVKAFYEAFKNVAGKREGGAGVPGGMEMMGPVGPAGPAGATGTDMPNYVYYNVERAEVTSPGQNADELEWRTIYVKDAKAEARLRWGMGAGGGPVAMDVAGAVGLVSSIYILPVLDFPVPPLVGRSLDASFAHPPEIPVMKRALRNRLGPDGRPLPPDASKREKPADKPDAAKPDAEKPDAEKPATDEPTDAPADGPGRQDVPTEPGVFPGMGPGMEGMMEQPGLMGPEMMGEYPGGPGMMPGGRAVRTLPNRLFRFVDRTVEPGKRYRYRARLMLYNPNYNQNPRFLERVDLGKERYITTEWSDPSGVIDVPRDDRLLVLSVRPSVWVSNEPTAKVAMVKWLNKEGKEPTHEEDKAFRGQVLNFPNVTWNEVDRTKTPRLDRDIDREKEKKDREKEKKDREKERKKKGKGMPGSAMEELMGPLSPTEMGPMGVPGAFGTQQEPIQVDFLTESLVLDMRGGQRIDLNGQGRQPAQDAKLNAPGEILVLDPEGNLAAHDELEDQAEFEKIQERKKPASEYPMGPMMMPGMEGMPGMPGDMLMGNPPPGKKGTVREPKRPKKEVTPRKK